MLGLEDEGDTVDELPYRYRRSRVQCPRRCSPRDELGMEPFCSGEEAYQGRVERQHYRDALVVRMFNIDWGENRRRSR